MIERIRHPGLLATLALVACAGDGPTGEGGLPENTPLVTSPSFLVSNAVPPSVVSNLVGSSAWVALQPGTTPAGARARLGYPLGVTEVSIVDGGFDPVEVPAATGDTVTVNVYDSAGQLAGVFRDVVRPTRRPIIVRTDPPPRKRDVALNMRMVVIFSEPMDPASVTVASVRLRQENSPVPGQVRLGSNGLSAEFEPNDLLEPAVEYTLEVTDGVRDRNGQVLTEPLTLSFTTVPTDPLDDESLSLAFARNGSSITVSTLRGDRITEIYRYGWDPKWSPNADALAFVCAGEGREQHICRIAPNGANLVRLTSGYLTGRSPTWSPDGRQIAFISLDCTLPDPYEEFWCGRPSLGRINPDGTGLTLISFPANVWAAWDLAWSPDGTRFAFTCLVDGDGSSLLDICTMSVNGGELVQLTSAPVHESHPAWSPDGNSILFQVAQEEDFEHPYWIAVMDESGGNLRRIGATVFGQYPSWSPDGSMIVFTGYFGTGPSGYGQGSVMMMDAEGKALTRVTDRSGDNAPVWRRR